jgi:hypothetical protein
MTLQQLEAIYKVNLVIGELEALEAVYTHGYYDGAGLTISIDSPSVVVSRPAPSTIIKIKKPDLR